MFKRWRAKIKLSKYRTTHPRQNVDEFGNIIIDECHMVCFVNDEYPSNHQIISISDVTSQWCFQFGSTESAIKWFNRRSNPIIYKVGSSFELNRLINSNYLPANITKSYFAGEIISFCLGPVWSSRLTEYDLYEKVSY